MTRIVAFAIVAVFMLAERALRRDTASRTTETTAEDQGTTRLIGFVYGLALNAGMLSPVLSRWKAAQLRPSWLSAGGLVLMVAGLALRIWSAVTLGRFYTRTLRTASDQPLVQTGPYAVVRHPGYLADLVMWLGVGLCSGTWIVAVTVALVMAFAYARRIAAEEAMLRRHLGRAYDVYCGRTPRLLPGIF